VKKPFYQRKEREGKRRSEKGHLAGGGYKKKKNIILVMFILIGKGVKKRGEKAAYLSHESFPYSPATRMEGEVKTEKGTAR